MCVLVRFSPYVCVYLHNPSIPISSVGNEEYLSVTMERVTSAEVPAKLVSELNYTQKIILSSFHSSEREKAQSRERRGTERDDFLSIWKENFDILYRWMERKSRVMKLVSRL